jgi:hypothetical protein
MLELDPEVDMMCTPPSQTFPGNNKLAVHVRVPCHHGMMHPQITDGGDARQGVVLQLGGWVWG